MVLGEYSGKVGLTDSLRGRSYFENVRVTLNICGGQVSGSSGGGWIELFEILLSMGIDRDCGAGLIMELMVEQQGAWELAVPDIMHDYSENAEEFAIPAGPSLEAENNEFLKN